MPLSQTALAPNTAPSITGSPAAASASCARAAPAIANAAAMKAVGNHLRNFPVDAWRTLMVLPGDMFTRPPGVAARRSGRMKTTHPKGVAAEPPRWAGARAPRRILRQFEVPERPAGVTVGMPEDA